MNKSLFVKFNSFKNKRFKKFSSYAFNFKVFNSINGLRYFYFNCNKKTKMGSKTSKTTLSSKDIRILHAKTGKKS